MSIITLTTDLGIQDNYVALVKAAIYKQLPEINIVDISNEISKFDIQEAAFVFKNCYKEFPEGTIHIIGVNDEISVDNQHIALKIDNQFIIGPDNGIFSLIFDEIGADKIVKLNFIQESNSLTFPTKDVFVIAACHLARGGTLEMIGNEISDFNNKKSLLKAVTEKNMIRGNVLYIDSYGNATTNIDKLMFDKIGMGRKFTILYGREDEEIKKISKKYKDVSPGNKLALFGTNNLLEISMNKGKASDLLGLHYYDTVRIEFK